LPCSRHNLQPRQCIAGPSSLSVLILPAGIIEPLDKLPEQRLVKNSGAFRPCRIVAAGPSTVQSTSSSSGRRLPLGWRKQWPRLPYETFEHCQMPAGSADSEYEFAGTGVGRNDLPAFLARRTFCIRAVYQVLITAGRAASCHCRKEFTRR